MTKVFAVFVGLLLGAGTGLAFAQGPEGLGLYQKQCRACHGVDGVPPPAMMKSMKRLRSLADPAFMASISVDSMVAVLSKGKGQMKPYAGKLSDDQLRAVAQYVRSLPEKTGKKS